MRIRDLKIYILKNDYDKYYCKNTVGMLMPITVKSKKDNYDKKTLESYFLNNSYQAKISHVSFYLE